MVNLDVDTFMKGVEACRLYDQQIHALTKECEEKKQSIQQLQQQLDGKETERISVMNKAREASLSLETLLQNFRTTTELLVAPQLATNQLTTIKTEPEVVPLPQMVVVPNTVEGEQQSMKEREEGEITSLSSRSRSRSSCSTCSSRSQSPRRKTGRYCENWNKEEHCSRKFSCGKRHRCEFCDSLSHGGRYCLSTKPYARVRQNNRRF